MPSAPGTPSPEAANTLTIDLTDNPDLQQLFGHKEIGDKCVLTLTLQLVSKDTKQVKSIVEKIEAEEGEYGDTSEEEIEPSRTEPVMMTMAKKKGFRPKRGGPSSRPPEPVENSLLPTVQSYA